MNALGDALTYVHPRDPQDIRPAPPAPGPDEADPRAEEHHGDDPMPDVIEPAQDEDDVDDVPVLYAPLPDILADEFMPLETDVGRQPTYMTPSHPSLSLHLLLNTHLRVLVRRAFTRGPGVQSLRFLQHICAITPNSSIPLLYPEATLFPSIFWCAKSNTMCGAIPATMYSAMRNRTQPGQLASIQDHLLVRLQDDSLLTSHDQLYVQWAFDVLINNQLNHNSALVVVRKGLEHLRQAHDGTVLQMQEGLLPFDELDSRRQVQRLAAQMSDVDGFDYFFTATCNDARTFGVRRVRAAIVASYGHEGPKMQRALQAYCAIMCRCWERTIRYFMHWLQHSPEQPCGQVISTWFRYEFQTHGAPGNKPHAHGFVKVADEQDSVKLARIKCRLSTMFSHHAGTDRRSLRARGLIEDERDLAQLHQLCNMLCFHQCDQANNRCQKLQKDGTTSCRVQQHPPTDDLVVL